MIQAVVLNNAEGTHSALCVCGAKTVKTLTVATMISMAAAAAYVFKRKIAK